MKIEAVSGLEANVCRDGVPLQEYDVETESALEGVKFIQATSGANFTVSLRVEPSRLTTWLEDYISCEVRLDGEFACSWVYYIKDAAVFHIRGRTGNVGDQSVLQKFVFGDLVTNDEPVGNIKSEEMKQLGEIRVQIRWARKLSTRIEEGKPVVTDQKDSLPEKCLKGRSISNRAAYGTPEPVPPTNLATTEYPRGMDPIAKFVFRYRSRKDLQIEGIIPRSPSPVPLEERDPNDLSAEEARELIRRMRTQESDTEVKIKKEKRARPLESEDDDSDDGEVEITEQRVSKRGRLSTDSGMELIDLTDD